jgi:hypothetical protein
MPSVNKLGAVIRIFARISALPRSLGARVLDLEFFLSLRSAIRRLLRRVSLHASACAPSSPGLRRNSFPHRSGRAVLVFAAALLPASAFAQVPRRWPDTFLARLEATALIETLNATLLAARSAKVRHVELSCGDHVLSVADNWYVPSRLTAAMNQSLESTDTPFGRAVADLRPFRRTFAAETLWRPLETGWEMRAPGPDHPGETLAIPDRIFEHRALLFTPDMKPFSEVDETYTGEILSFGPPP